MEKQNVKCPKCNHKFKTKSKLILVCCNSCGNKFKREENLNQDNAPTSQPTKTEQRDSEDSFARGREKASKEGEQ